MTSNTNLFALNNNAVDTMIEGTYEDALKQLHKALGVAAKLSSFSIPKDIEEEALTELEFIQCNCTMDDDSDQDQPIWKDYSCLAVYDRPCYVIVSQDEHEDSSLSSTHEISSHSHRQASLAMLFNLGLIYHLLAMQHPPTAQTSHMLNKALDMYRKTLRLVQHSSSEEGDDNRDLPTDQIFTIILYNNIACICMEQFRQLEAFGCLRALTHHLKSACVFPHNRNMSFQDAIVHCHRNTLNLNFVTTVCAPAG